MIASQHSTVRWIVILGDDARSFINLKKWGLNCNTELKDEMLEIDIFIFFIRRKKKSSILGQIIFKKKIRSNFLKEQLQANI